MRVSEDGDRVEDRVGDRVRCGCTDFGGQDCRYIVHPYPKLDLVVASSCLVPLLLHVLSLRFSNPSLT